MPRHDTVYERHPPAPGLVEEALRGSRRGSFWLDDAAADAVAYDRLTADTTADLAVVGGGYTGLWTALLAKQRDPGARVVLLEANTVGWAASGRNGGFCDASLTHGHENGLSRWPDEIDELNRLGMRNLDEIEATVRELALDVQFERTGALAPAVEPHQVAWVREYAEEAPATLGETRYLDEAETRDAVNSPTFLASAWDRDSCALVHPARLAHELARVATDLGVEVVEGTRVQSLDGGRGTGPVTLTTPRGRVRAGRVALATNVFPSLLRRYRLHTVPVYDYVLMTEPLTGEQLGQLGWTGRQGIGDLANQFHYYRLSADNRILFGGYDAIYHYGRRVDASYEERPESFRRLASHLLTTFPQLEGIRFTHRWAGAIDTSTRFCAFFAQAHRGRVSYAAGFTGLGVAATRFAAQVMLDQLAGESTERTQLAMVRDRPLPFPPEPFAYAGVEATRWSLDRADHRAGRRNLFLRALDAAGLGFDS